MKTFRFLSARLTATPIILGPGRYGHILTGYYPGKRKSKPPPEKRFGAAGPKTPSL